MLLQAGSSGRGRDFAAEWAELIFTGDPGIEVARVALQGPEGAHRRARAATPTSVKMLPMAYTVVGESRAHAEEREQLFLNDLVDPMASLTLLSELMNYDFSGMELDAPITDELIESVSGIRGLVQNLRKHIGGDTVTLADLAGHRATLLQGPRFVGTGPEVADQMEEWFEHRRVRRLRASPPPTRPAPTRTSCAWSCPSSSAAGVFRDRYTGTTLRDHLGLERPGPTRRPDLTPMTGGSDARTPSPPIRAGHAGQQRADVREGGRRSGADLVFLDLEDACAPLAKESARGIAVAALTGQDWGRTVRAVRVNGLDTPVVPRRRHRDRHRARGTRSTCSSCPKARTARDVWWFDVLLTQLETKLGLPTRIGLEVLIEEAEGLSNAAEIARSSDRLEAIIFGAGDLSASLQARVDGNFDPVGEYPGDFWHFARVQVLAAARARGHRRHRRAVPRLPGPRRATGGRPTHASLLGFDGKWAIHPSQIADRQRGVRAHRATRSPTPSEAIEIYRASEADGVGAIGRDGKLVDAAHMRLAENVLHKASLAGDGDGADEPAYRVRPVGHRQHRHPVAAGRDRAPGPGPGRRLVVHSPDKAGRDAGELCGLAPTGRRSPPTTSRTSLALGADCVLYMPQGCDFDDVCRLLESGHATS